MRKLFVSLTACTLIGVGMTQGAVANSAPTAARITITTPPLTLIKGQSFTLTGEIPEEITGSSTPISIQRYVNSQWENLPARVITSSNGWHARITIPQTGSSHRIRAISGEVTGPSVVFKALSQPKIPVKGPGSRVLGVDISRWQHQGKPINFTVMKAAGVGFVIIKASDGMASEDRLAKPLALTDAKSAKKAGLIVGYYHRARVPQSNNISTLTKDATRQAKIAATRLSELGGYGTTTLPYVLDIEGVDDAVKPASITAWMKVWLEVMTKKTGRTPTVYSYRTMLSQRVTQDWTTKNTLRKSHLWLAQPGDPSDRRVLVGKKVKGPGCFAMAWTFNGCSLGWTMWQYTNSGNRDKYGIPWSPRKGKCPKTAKFCFSGKGLGQYHLDLNVFNGSSADLAALARNALPRSILDYQ